MLYKRVDFLAYEIRLLNIQEVSDDEELCCTLEHTTLIEPGSFYALSYCWGDQSRKKKISINNIVVEVGDNLEAALRQLRLRGYLRIWIDRLCINQDDDDERGLQIRNMRQIYSQALYVILWLGDDLDNTARAVKYLIENKRYKWFPGRRYTAVNGMPTEAKLRTTKTEQEWDVQRWRIFKDFFELSYWRRTWVIQEIASSSQVKVLFGREALEWQHVTTVLAHWKEHTDHVPVACSSYKYAAELDHFRIRYKGPRPIGLLEAIQWSQYALVTEQRDKIYALLGLTSDGSRLVPMPNYQRSFQQILCDLTKALLSVAKSSEAYISDYSKNSWPWWDSVSLDIWIKVNTALESPFCSLYPIFLLDQGQQSLDQKSLHTEGILLGQVCQTTSHPPSPMSFTMRLKSYMENKNKERVNSIHKQHDLYPSGLPAAIWDTLCLGQSTSNFDPSTCLNYLWNHKNRGEVYGGKIGRLLKGRDPWAEINSWLRSNSALRIGPSTLQEIAQSNAKSNHFKNITHASNTPLIYDIIENDVATMRRTLDRNLAFVVTETGLIGWAPSTTEIGDWIFYIKGTSIPIILRQKEMATNSTVQEYFVVGGAYIHMDKHLPGSGGFGDWAGKYFMKPDGLQSIVIA